MKNIIASYIIATTIYILVIAIIAIVCKIFNWNMWQAEAIVFGGFFFMRLCKYIKSL